MNRLKDWSDDHQILGIVMLAGLGMVVGLWVWKDRVLREKPPQPAIRILTQTITFNNLDLPPKPEAYLFNSREDWRSFVDRYHLQGLDQVERLVDFANESFIFINGGSYLTQGNYLSLKDYQITTDLIDFEFVLHEAGNNCPREHLLNYPTLGLKVAKFAGRLDTSFLRESFDCQSGEGVLEPKQLYQL